MSNLKAKLLAEGIRSAIERLEKEARDVQTAIKNIQDTCEHPDDIIKNRSDTDCDNRVEYWREFECPDCKRKKSEYQIEARNA